MEKIKVNIKKLFDIIMAPSMAFLPGNLAFFIVLSIFPILTLIVVIASMFSIDIGLLTNFINSTLPTKVANMIIDFISGKGFDTNILISMIIGFFLASNGAHAIILASNNLYGFPNSSYIKRRIKAFFLTFALILLFLFGLLFLGFGNHILELVLSLIKDASLASIISKLFYILKWPIAILIIFVFLKLIYTIAPDWKILSKHTTRGALFTTLVWVASIFIYSFWINHFANYDLFYGSLSNIIILMLMIYILSYVLVIGIAINAKTYEYKIED